MLVTGERIPAPAAVARPGLAGIDHRDLRPQGGQLVGQGQADQPTPDDHHIRAFAHGHRVQQTRRVGAH